MLALSEAQRRANDKYNAEDGLKQLCPENDAATCILGKKWRTPTLKDFQELMECCKWQWCIWGDYHGCRVIGPNGNSIFLHAGGTGFRSGRQGLAPAPPVFDPVGNIKKGGYGLTSANVLQTQAGTGQILNANAKNLKIPGIAGVDGTVNDRAGELSESYHLRSFRTSRKRAEDTEKHLPLLMDALCRLDYQAASQYCT